MKLIIYELNEVPRRLWDFYVNKNPNSAFAKVNKYGSIINTITKDKGELSPWITWPSVHRGVYNEQHKITSINQDLSFSKTFRPVWEILDEKSIEIGLFGSLQSFPPIKSKNIKFYLPDTFAPSPDAFPKNLEIFQDFNLLMTNKNKAISRGISLKEIKKFLNLLLKGLISKKVGLKIIFHIFKEKLNPKYKTRRSTMQNVLSFDIYLRFLKKYQPKYTSYFTNHVAGMMHRYWRDLFPNDFNNLNFRKDSFHSNTIMNAMNLANDNLRELINFSDKSGYNIWIVSSMGQSAIDRGEYYPELILKDLKKLIFEIGLEPENYKLLPAMQPDYCIKCKDKDSLYKLRNNFKLLKDNEGQILIEERDKPKGLNMHIKLRHSKIYKKSKIINFNEKIFKLEEIGFELIRRDIGTVIIIQLEY